MTGQSFYFRQLADLFGHLIQTNLTVLNHTVGPQEIITGQSTGKTGSRARGQYMGGASNIVSECNRA